MSIKGKTTVNVVIVGMGLSWLTFWYFQQTALSERVTKIETLQPQLIQRLDRIEVKIDNINEKTNTN